MRESRTSSRVILLNLAKCEVAFYAVYYIISSLTFALYSEFDLHGVSFAVSGVVFGVMVRERVWDYALTVTLVHTALSCLVMLNFPLKWSWWVCCALALLLMMAVGELVGLVLRWQCHSRVTPLPKDGEGNHGYLVRKS